MNALSRILLFSLVVPLAAGCSIAETAVDAAERGVERAVTRETDRRTDRATTDVIEGFENAVRCSVGDQACAERARAQGRDVVYVDQDGNEVRAERNAPEDVNVNPDFQAGSRVLFHEDFSNDPVGNFPSSLEFVKGNWEIAEWQGRRLLRHTGPRHANIIIPLPEELPENFTIETEIYFPHGNHHAHLFTKPVQSEQEGREADYNYFILGGYGNGVKANKNLGLPSSVNKVEAIHERLMPFRIIVEGEYAKVYVGNDRVANVPNVYIPRMDVLQLWNPYFADEEYPMYFGPIRVAAIE